MKVWLGGATGFLGRHVAASLAERGAELVLVSRGGGVLELGADGARRTVEVSPVDVLDADRVAESARGATHAILARLPNVKSVKVNTVWSPKWDPRVHSSEVAQMLLGLI